MYCFQQRDPFMGCSSVYDVIEPNTQKVITAIVVGYDRTHHHFYICELGPTSATLATCNRLASLNVFIDIIKDIRSLLELLGSEFLKPYAFTYETIDNALRDKEPMYLYVSEIEAVESSIDDKIIYYADDRDVIAESAINSDCFLFKYGYHGDCDDDDNITYDPLAYEHLSEAYFEIKF